MKKMEKRSLKERLKNEYLGQGFAAFCGILIIVITIAIIIFIASKGIRIFTTDGYSLSEFLFTNNWKPNKGGEPSFGALAFILGSTLVSIGAVILSAPIAVALAIFVNVISSKFGKRVMKPSLEILL
jgi:phosphate transport system permease protein